MNEVEQYVVRSEANEIVFSSPGLLGLKQAVNRVVNGIDGVAAGIIERGPLNGDTTDFQGMVIGVASQRPLLGLEERGHVFVTREMTAAERVAINHYSDKLSWLDLSQVCVEYAGRYSDLETTTEYKRGLAGLEAAIRAVRTEGWGLIMRKIEGIPGEQPIAVFAASGYYFTKSADERERTLMQTVREAMEYYGEFPPVLPLDELRARTMVLDAICIAREHIDQPLAQASAFHNLMGRIMGRLPGAVATVLGVSSTVTHCTP